MEIELIKLYSNLLFFVHQQRFTAKHPFAIFKNYCNGQAIFKENIA